MDDGLSWPQALAPAADIPGTSSTSGAQLATCDQGTAADANAWAADDARQLALLDYPEFAPEDDAP